MAWTGFYRDTRSGLTLYAQTLGDRSAETVSGPAVDGDGTLYQFAGLVDDVEYEVFVQDGAEPSATDVAIAALGNVPSATEISDRIERDGGLLDEVADTLGTPNGASIVEDIAGVKSDTTTLLSRVTSSVANLWANLIAMIAGSGGSAAWTATAMGNVGATNVGSGSEEKELTITVDGQPADGVAVWITTDSAGSNVVAGTLYTDALGKVTFMLDAGTYYAWKQKSGANFTNPESFTVTA